MSITNQTLPPTQVIIVDDGSRTDTTILIEKWKTKLPISHTWQPDRGFRVARSRNLGILKLNAPYVIMIDGDCILPPWFIENHAKLREPGKIVAGNRFITSKNIFSVGDQHSSSSDSVLFYNQKFWRLPLGPLRNLNPSSWARVRTCNMGLATIDLIATGGFDERFIGWGLEDSDLALRLISNGLKVKNGKYSASVAHLPHEKRLRDGFVSNQQLLDQTKTNGCVQAKKSVVKNI